MNILFIGDIFGSPGRRIVADHLEDIVKTNAIDLVIANGARPGHFGLRGMHERSHNLGAHLDVWTELDLGTEVELSIPAPVAYGSSRSRARFSEWLGFHGKERLTGSEH